MQKIKALIIIFSLLAASIASASAATVKAGGVCSKVGIKYRISTNNLICKKIGKKLIWTNAPLDLKVEEITFENLYEKRKYISYTAWKKSSDFANSNSSKIGKIDLNTGPNTKPWNQKISTTFEAVSKLFPNYPEAKEILVIRFSYKDLDWATNLLKSKITQWNLDNFNRNENGHVVDSNCSVGDSSCQGSKELSTPDGTAVLLIGVPNRVSSNDMRMTTGMLEAHEYFHSIQRVSMFVPNLTPYNWPPRWFFEGSAEWVQNIAIMKDDFMKYEQFKYNDCILDGTCSQLKESDINTYLSYSSKGDTAIPYSSFIAYNLGSRLCEALVSIAGVESLVKLWNEESKGIGWDESFKNTYGVEWKTASQSLTKAIAANIADAI